MTAAARVFASALSGAAAITAWMRRRLRLRLGGYTGDCLGAVQQLAELAFLVGALAIRLGVPLTYSALTVIVLVAALPSASNVTMLSERFGADTARVGNIILVSTALAFLSFSLVVKLLR